MISRCASSVPKGDDVLPGQLYSDLSHAWCCSLRPQALPRLLSAHAAPQRLVVGYLMGSQVQLNGNASVQYTLGFLHLGFLV